jgi:predicted dehydrogenase
MKKLIFILIVIFTIEESVAQPLRLAVAGISHGHVSWILARKNDAVAQLVGVYEPDKVLAAKMMKQFKLDSSLFYSDLHKMLEAVKPEGVSSFGTTLQHRAVVEACAPRGIHVMVEKPLATTVSDAASIASLAKQYRVHVLTNYETSWYPTTDKTKELFSDTAYAGKIRKVVVHDGHEGPREIGVSDDFFNWLTDPVQNGGGALMDFGCYGANLMTLLMKGQQPLSVTAVTRQFKPHIYPKVDDEATIVVNYPDAQCIIQASWNWPFARKDMEVYGERGYVITRNNNEMKAKGSKGPEVSYVLKPEETGTYTSPFTYFADVIRGRIQVPAYGPYSLENNVMVVKILDAARQSALTGKTVYFK